MRRVYAPGVNRGLVEVVPPRVHDLHVDVLVAPLLLDLLLLGAARRPRRRGEVRQQGPLRSLHRTPQPRPARRPLVPPPGGGRRLPLVAADPRHGLDVGGAAVGAEEGGGGGLHQRPRPVHRHRGPGYRVGEGVEIQMLKKMQSA